MTSGIGVGSEDPWALAPRAALQRMTDLARRVLGAHSAMLSSFTADRQVVLCQSGHGPAIQSIPIANSLCHLVMDSNAAIVAPNLRDHAILRDKDPTSSIEAYIGTPIRLSHGLVLGTLCVTDIVPHAWTADDLEIIGELAACLAGQIELSLENARRESAEAALRASQIRLLAVADNLPGLVFERRKVDAERADYTFFGAAKARLASVRTIMDTGLEGVLSFVHADDRERVRVALARSNADETDLDLSFRALSDAGTTRWLRAQSTVRRSHDGGVFWDGLCFDISDLVATRDEAEAARAAKDTVLVNVSHELRTPLQAILGFSEFLATETRPDLVAAHARHIRVASQSVLAIVNQLLDSAGADASRAEPLDLRAFAETCLSLVGPQAIEKSIATHLAIDDGVPPRAMLDRQRLHQVVLNLLNNAVKFTDTGTVTLRIGRTDDGLRFSVIDTGIGIKADEKDRLFQRFSRIEPGTDMRDGTGLGLSIAKALVEEMKGTVNLSSTYGAGSTFWFDVPATLSDDRAFDGSGHSAATAEVAMPDAAPVSQEMATSSQGRILLADDLDLNRKLISDMLSIEGYVVDCVADGQAAVEAVQAEVYDLILMDMIMPGMDGLAATRAIRALGQPFCDVPIVALTANSFRDQLDACLKAGMDATLTKPMSFDSLVQAVATWTSGRTKAA